MLTLNFMVYDILNSLRSHYSDDEHIDIRDIAFAIKNQRALWLRNQFNKGETIDDEVIQDLGAVEVELINTLDLYANLNIPLEKKIYRSKQTIPGTIERHRKPTITYVGSVNQVTKKFKLVDHLEVPYVGNGRLNKNEIFCFLMNDRMHIIGNSNNLYWKGLKYINIRGVFEDPELVGKFRKANGEPSFTWDSKYPLKHWMYTYIKEMVVHNYFKLPKVADTINNANDDLAILGNNKSTPQVQTKEEEEI